MRIEPMPLAGAAVIHADPFSDQRGIFARFYCAEALRDLLGPRRITQINFSSNLDRGTLRGLHYQLSPRDEMKFVRCLRGEIFSVIVDVREDSATFLQWQSTRLSAAGMSMLCVPEGCAHGYQCLDDDCELMYFVTSPYVESLQAGLRYDDPVLAIPWPLEVTRISERDARHPLITRSVEGVVA